MTKFLHETNYPSKTCNLCKKDVFDPSWNEGCPNGTIAEPEKAQDPTNPEHYKDKAIEHWDVVEAWGLDYLLGNCTKYISRYQQKGTPLIDLKKAAVYLNRKIELMEREEIVNSHTIS